MIEKDDLTNFLRKSFTYIRKPFLVLEVKDNKTAIVYANKKLLGLFACKNMAELTDFAWEKLFPLTTGLSGDHAEFEHMTVADAKGQEHMLMLRFARLKLLAGNCTCATLRRSTSTGTF
ncbi:hypothetical protein ACXO19_02595 [Lactobacillus delbrueckii subsp. bulgaricus]